MNPGNHDHVRAIASIWIRPAARVVIALAVWAALAVLGAYLLVRVW